MNISNTGGKEMVERHLVLETRQLSKRFAGHVALSDVSLKVHAGEVLCLLGDNGAGKSTLIKMLSGVFQPTSGEIIVDGKPVVVRNPGEARGLGIAAVQQFGGTVPLMSVVRNFFLGAEITKGVGPFKRIDSRTSSDLALEHLSGLGLTRLSDPNRLVGSLSGGERQALSIARAAYFGARLLILDEPTSALGVKEAGIVLAIIRRAADRGIAVIFITHNAQHATAAGDHFTVLIQGQVAADFAKGERTRAELLNLMAGGEEMQDLELHSQP